MDLKQMVGIESAKYVKDGMTVGLGTGSTAYFMVEEIGRRIKEEGLTITGVTTSKATEKQALGLGIPLKSIDEVDYVDITIDGADEISNDFQGTKGGGAALLFEKIVATNSKENIWIVDESKMVTHLGAFPLPVEVIPYGSEQIFKKMKLEKSY
jgi:ribose 5-phosphate isomerase A